MKMRVGIVLSAMIASTFWQFDRPQAQQDCAQVMAQIDSETRAFNEEARKQHLDFLVDNGVETAIADAGSILKVATAPTAKGAVAMEKHVQTLENWETIQEAFGVTLKDLEECLAPGSNCNLIDFLHKQNEATQRWLQTFLSGGTQQALDRVGRARSLIQNEVKQLTGTTQGSISAAASCANNYQQQLAQAERDPVDLQPVTKVENKGPGVGHAIAGIIVGGAIGAGAYVVGQKMANASSGSSPGPGVCGYDSRVNACRACTCTEGVDCVNSPQCGGGDCWTTLNSRGLPPFC